MKICVFSIVTYWHGVRGGMDLHGKHLLEGLSERGHEISIISTKHPEGKEYEEINGIKIYYLKDTIFGSSRKRWKKQSISKFIDIVKTEAIDIVLSQQTAGYGVVRIAKRMKIPFVTIMHGYETMIFLSVLNQVKNFRRGYFSLIKVFLSSIYYSIFQEFPVLVGSSAIIAVSDKVARVIGKRPFIDNNKINTVNYGIDIRLFNSSEIQRKNMRRKLNISDDERVILFLSLLSKQKGCDIAIKSFHKLLQNKKFNLKLVIAGEGEYLEEAKMLVNQLGIKSRVVFTGFVPNEDAPQYYNASDLFVFPTLRLESFGIVIAEAMVCNKPIIASNIGSIPEVIDNEINGILVTSGSINEIVEKITYLLENPRVAEEIAKNAREKAVKQFSLNRMIEETIKVFEMVLAEKSKKSYA